MSLFFPSNPQYLLQADLLPTVLRLSLPIALGLFSVTAFNLLDAALIGQLGPRPLAAFGFAMPVLMVLTQLAGGLGVGSATLVARALGQRHPVQAKLFATEALKLSLAVGLLLALVGTLALPWLFHAMGVQAAVWSDLWAYMQVWLWGLPLVLLPVVASALLRATGDTVASSGLMVISALLNALLDPLLLFGLAGWPALGLPGAAVAALLARLVSVGVGVYWLQQRKQLFCWRHCFSLFRTLPAWRAILSLSMPAALNAMMLPIGLMLITALLARYGEEAVAAFALANRVESLVLMGSMALATGIAPFVSQNAASTQFQRLRDGLCLTLRLGLGYGLVVFVLLLATAPVLAGSFSQSPAVQRWVTAYLTVVPVSYLLLNSYLVVNSAFSAVGRPGVAFLLNALRMLGVYWPLALGLQGPWGVAGVFLAAAFTNAGMGLIGVVGFRQFFLQEARAFAQPKRRVRLAQSTSRTSAARSASRSSRFRPPLKARQRGL